MLECTAKNQGLRILFKGSTSIISNVCTLGCPKMQLFFMSRCIWWVRLLENDFTFNIFDFVHYSSERCSKTKTKFFYMERSQLKECRWKFILKKNRGLLKFYYTTFLVNLHHLSYFDPNKKSANFFLIIFSGIP